MSPPRDDTLLEQARTDCLFLSDAYSWSRRPATQVRSSVKTVTRLDLASQASAYSYRSFAALISLICYAIVYGLWAGTVGLMLSASNVLNMVKALGGRWVPLESNPEVLERFARLFGVTDESIKFTDVFGVSEDLLCMVPRPVLAFLVVFPINEATEKLSKERAAAQKAEAEAFSKEHKVFFMKQYVPNACGTVGLMHALMNNTQNLGAVESNCLLKRFMGAGEGSSNPAEVSEVLAKALTESKELASIHEQCATASDTHIDLDVNLHFACLTWIGGRCVELDGRQDNVILHGAAATNEEFVAAAATAIRRRSMRAPDPSILLKSSFGDSAGWGGGENGCVDPRACRTVPYYRPTNVKSEDHLAFAFLGYDGYATLGALPSVMLDAVFFSLNVVEICIYSSDVVILHYIK
eukprot:gene3722-2621_t